MATKNIDVVLHMVEEYLNGETDSTSFVLDFPYEIQRRYQKMCAEDSEWTEMIQFCLVEHGTDRCGELAEEDFRELIERQYNDVLEGVY